VAGSGCQFIVGTERDLPGLQVDLAVILDGDGPLLAPSYRAAEDGLRLLGRAVATAGSGRGRRGLVQTADPDNPVLTALRDGAPVPLVRSDAARRASLGFPPGGEIIVVEATGTVDPGELVVRQRTASARSGRDARGQPVADPGATCAARRCAHLVGRQA
jgi:primosomal protein N' (replication factor Y)